MSTADDRERGLMVGIAAGNLLGIVVEGRTQSEVRRRFPDGVRDIAARPGYPDDDDLAQSIIIAEAVEEGPLDVEDLGHRFWEWGEVNGLGMGTLTSRVLTLFGGDYPRGLRWGTLDDVRQPKGMAIEDASREAWGGKSAGNGALMRCAPIAVRWRDDAVALARNSVVSAVPTHWDRRCGWSCVALNIGIAAALRGEMMDTDVLIAASEEAVRPSLPELSQFGYEAQMPGSVRNAIRQAAASEIGDIEFDGSNMGFTLLALEAGLISLWRAPDFEHGLRAVVEAGGDTDTNGAIAGAALGARFGVDAIPQRWRDRIAELREGRTPMEEYADKLAAARG
ncbi:MAG: ADP-ribosylglycohydrolase family protein [Chloroflexota bacterium]|nr:ADP-ribosylglycohydrolase family protein [Chloroflexota bacterium]MDE2884492.1 ADP-ribosylglycohydrolase family protein [Chloroflexota bacterium]